MTRLEPLQHVDAGVLSIAYHAAGPAMGPPVLLMHGFPYDIHAYAEVVPRLAAEGCRVIVPYLRGFGPTRFLWPDTPRSGEQAARGLGGLGLRQLADAHDLRSGEGVHHAADERVLLDLGADLLALLDALRIPRAVLAGYDWGGRAACVVAALWP